MNKIYFYDINVLNELGITIEEYKSLMYVYLNRSKEVKNETLNLLQEKGLIKILKEDKETIIVVREKGKLLIEKYDSVDTELTFKKVVKKSSREINNSITEFISEYRLLFKGLKPGSMGSHASCVEKMSRWMKENPQYTPSQIINATKSYINSMDNYTFLQQADYFIYKKTPSGESSRLSAFIDEEEVLKEGWSSKLI